MEERLKFVARLLDGEMMATLCREFGISRKTGYKIFNRYKEIGIDGLNDQSRRLRSSSPAEPPRQALTEPDVTLSRHPALLVQQVIHTRTPSVQTRLDGLLGDRQTISQSVCSIRECSGTSCVPTL